MKTEHNSILFISGWAGHDRLFPELSKKFTFFTPFASHGQSWPEKLIYGNNWDTVIAWSLGAHLCMKHLKSINAHRLILLAPFLDFCSYTSKAKVLEMINGMKTSPTATLRWFWKLCQVPGPPRVSVEHPANLVQGLVFLMNSGIQPESSCQIKTIHLYHGLEDRIVPPAASQKILEHLPDACYTPVPYGHFIPEEEIFRIIHALPDKKTF